MPLGEWALSERRVEGGEQRMNKRELEDENSRLRERLEEAYDVIGGALGFDSDNDVESDASDLDDEE